MRADMRGMGISGIERKRLIDHGGGSRRLAGLPQGKGVLAEKPPVIPVMGGERSRVSEQFCFPPGLTREANEAVDAGASLGDQRIARMLRPVGANGAIGFRHFAIDQEAQSMQMRRLLLRQAV